jgi:hypothetical protein
MEAKGISLWTRPPSKARSYLISAIVLADPTPQTKMTNSKPFGMFMPGDVSAFTLTYSFELDKGRISSCTTIAGFRLGAVEKAAVAPAANLFLQKLSIL